MALVRSLERQPPDRYSVHGQTFGTYKIFEHAGGIYLQINTFGSQFRRDQAHPSQTIQFGPEALAQLQDIMTRELLAACPDPVANKGPRRFGILPRR